MSLAIFRTNGSIENAGFANGPCGVGFGVLSTMWESRIQPGSASCAVRRNSLPSRSANFWTRVSYPLWLTGGSRNAASRKDSDNGTASMRDLRTIFQ
jgi:hypothetical protein